MQRRWLLPVLAGVLIFGIATTSMNWVKFVSLRSSWAYDLAYFRNAAFNVTQGRDFTYILPWAWFDQEDHDGPSIFRSTHFSPVQFFSFYISSRIEVLMLVQSLVIGAGAIPLFLLALRRSRDPALASLLASAYLLHPVVLHMAFNDFRPIQFGISAALFALWFHATGRWTGFVVSSVLLLACRPEYALLLASFPLLNWRAASTEERSWRWKLAPIAIACLWMGMTHVYYLYAYDRPWPMLGRTASHSSISGLAVESAARVPGLFRLVLLPAVGSLLFPETFVIALAFVAGADRLTPPEFPHLDLHHLSPAIPPLFWGFVLGVTSLWIHVASSPRRAWAARALVLVVTLACFGQFAFYAARTYLIGGFPRYPELDAIDRTIPPDGTVVVPMALSARFADHTRVLVYEVLPAPGWSSFSDERKAGTFAELIRISDLVVTESNQGLLEDLVARSGRFGAVVAVGAYHLYVPKPGSPRPAEPDQIIQKMLGWDRMSPFQMRWMKPLPA